MANRSEPHGNSDRVASTSDGDNGVPRRQGERQTPVIIGCFAAVLIIAVTFVSAGRYVKRERHVAMLNRELITAICRYDTNTVVSLLDEGADPNSPAKARAVTTAWQIILGAVGRSKTQTGPRALQVATTPMLANPSRDIDPFTPRPEQVRIMRALLEHGADVNYSDDTQNSALNYAACWLDNAMVDLLVAFKADVNHGNSIGETPLMEAAGAHNLASVKALLAHHANVNAKSRSGYTPLIYAAQGPDETIGVVRELLDHGADPNIPEEHGYRAPWFATQVGSLKIGRLLSEFGGK